jgi:ubiquinone/menaquinone biosynthesis C-methylase UbiE
MKKNHENEVKEIYNKLAKRYHKITAHHFFNAYFEVPATSSLLKYVRNKKILDLGCGTGRHTIILKKRGAKVWGLDLSPKMLEIAKSEIKDVDFKVGSVYKLPYKSNFFDVVVAGLVIGYFKNLDNAFKEIYRVLKNNGIFVFSFTNPLTEISTHIKDKPETYRKFGNYFKEGKTYAHWPTFKVKMPYYHRTLQTLIRTIIKNKFVIEDFVDAKPVKEGKKVNPNAYKTYSKIPHFCVFKVRKLTR